MTSPLRVGIVGANAARGWARDAHAPALARLTQYTLAAVSARTQPLAEEAQLAFGAQRAYSDSLALVRAPEIDVVAVTVRVPEHRAVVLAGLEAGKHVYCEWPLGCDVVQAQEMAVAVNPGQHVMIGLQALAAPAIRHAAELARSGALGSLKVLRVLSPTAGWGAAALPHYAYLQDKRTGATFEAIAGGHTLAAIEAIVGAYAEVDARNSTLIDSVRIQGTDEVVQRTCADHMMVLGQHETGCVSNLEIIGGAGARPFQLELFGERGWLKITGGMPGGFQVGNLRLETNISVEPVAELVAPELAMSAAGYVAEAYSRFAEQIRTGIIAVPDFAAASRLTLLIDTIGVAAQSGTRQRLGSPTQMPPAT
jgi:predicted dehydrogenase